MQMPKKVKLGYHNISIKSVKELNNGQDAGQYRYIDKSILIAEHDSTHLERETLFHELLHACLDDNPIVPRDSEEALVLWLSPKIMELLTRNPKLAKYLTGL